MAARAYRVTCTIKVAVCRSSAVCDTLAGVPYDTIAYIVLEQHLENLKRKGMLLGYRNV